MRKMSSVYQHRPERWVDEGRQSYEKTADSQSSRRRRAWRCRSIPPEILRRRTRTRSPRRPGNKHHTKDGHEAHPHHVGDVEPMDAQPSKQRSQTKHPGNPKTSGGPYRGDEESHDPAPPDPEPECCQQHQGPQRIESGDTEGESRSEERQHRERLLGSHFSNGVNCPRVAQQRSSLNFTSMPSSCYHLWVGFAR